MKIDKEYWHDSMRGYCAGALYNLMDEDNKIWVITADLGYGMWDKIREDFPDRFINTMAAEQGAMGVAIGLALEGQIPFFYSITTFALYRPFEAIRNYVNHEQIPVKILAAGRDKDYAHDGFSHHSEDAKDILKTALPQIKTYWPETKVVMEEIIEEVAYNQKPSFVSLRR